MKKKFLLFILIFVTMICFMSNACAQDICDFNDDGKIDNMDVLSLNTMLSAEAIPARGTLKFKLADCNRDGEINESDVKYIEKTDFSTTSKVSCGNVTGIPSKIPYLTSLALIIIQVAVPVILVIMGAMDLFKGVTAQKEDEIKKGQQLFIKRLIVGALIFFVVVIAKLLVSVVADSSSFNIVDCIDCFIDNSCS